MIHSCRLDLSDLLDLLDLANQPHHSRLQRPLLRSDLSHLSILESLVSLSHLPLLRDPSDLVLLSDLADPLDLSRRRYLVLQ